jgi:penicillin-binding protein 1B
MKKLKYIFYALFAVLIVGGIALGTWLMRLDAEVKEKLQTKKFLPPTEYYSAPESFFVGTQLNPTQLNELFVARHYRLRTTDQKLFPGDFIPLSQTECSTFTPEPLPAETASCLIFNPQFTGDPEQKENSLQLIIWDAAGQIIQLRKGNPLQVTTVVGLEPQLVAQFIGNEPILQTPMALGEMPTLCLKAVLAIEDAQFLEHSGVSLTGIGRAMLKNTFGAGPKQGGSTITQQMVKNYFLTSERTFKRKFTEFFMSLILENHASKDEILETYLNIIYLGQNGPFQIRGFGSASQYYFEKPIQNLNIGECALLAAIVNSPGLFDPFHKPENALKRRKMVITRMKDLEFISPQEADAATAQALPVAQKTSISETAPYYLHAANKQLQEMGIKIEGLRIFTGLDLNSQKQAQEAVRNQLSALESENKKIKGLKAKGLTLEGVLLAANNITGLVASVVGGRSYRLTQFNRATEGHRQVGSIMKPFVYLTALRQGELNGKIYDPVTPLKDEKFSYRFDRQSWSPDNYGKKYFGEVPAYFALKNSLNAATASLGLEVGLDKIIETARLLGVKSNLEKLPSITLGAFELYPMEVLESYVALARLGSHIPLSFVRAVTTPEGKVLYQFSPSAEQRIDASATASLVSMMKQTIQSGTAQLVNIKGFTQPAAGKTGTTSDYKDAWFAGFTPYLTSVVWIGYDNNTPHGLTGASGPVPIWTDYMRNVSSLFPKTDFPWPESTEKLNWTEADGVKQRTIDLIFRKDKPRSQPLR